MFQPTATITIPRGPSVAGGLDYARMCCETLTWKELYGLGEQLWSVGSLQRLSGYEIVSAYAIQQLGETFTVQQLLDYISNARRLQAEREERRRQNLVRCDCGHTVPRAEVMNASCGTACSDCYDRMS